MDHVPPDDADDWSDEEWLSWLVETDADIAPGEEPPPTRPARSRGSSMLYAAMFGLHQAIYGAQEEVTIVEEADGQPDEHEGLEVHLEPDSPDDSTVVLRPWLIQGHDD